MNILVKRKKEKSKKDSIFVITTIQRIDEAKNEPSDRYGSVRTVGFRKNFKSADETVRVNMCDIHEYLYNYACIEEIGPHIYPELRGRWFYKFNREEDMYERIDTPDYISEFELFCNIG